jgi:hypothetical protein
MEGKQWKNEGLLDIFERKEVIVLVCRTHPLCQTFKILPVFCFQALLDFFIKQLECFGASDGIILKYCVILLKILSTTDIFTRLFMCLEYTTNKENIYDTFLLTVRTAIQ